MKSVAEKLARSWHHRMARLIADAYYPRCEAPNCPRAAVCICEWDQDQGGKVVSRRKLYCSEHAASFAAKHRIYMADLPDVRLSQLETASRDGWKYSDEGRGLPAEAGTIDEGRKDNSVQSVKSVADTHHEGHEETRSNNSVNSVLSVANNNHQDIKTLKPQSSSSCLSDFVANTHSEER